MIVNSNARPGSRVATVARLALVLALAAAVAACGKDEPAPTAATAPAAATAPVVTAETAVSAKVAGMSVDQLREAARTAYAENRLYAPAENNAVEYYLALRDKQPGDAAVASALTDLLPMTVIAIEQSVNREDFTEAQRLAALLEKADAQHPALARLKTSITTQQQAVAQRAQQQALSAEEEAKRQADLEKKRQEDQKRQQDEAARQLAASQTSERQQAAERQAAERQAAERQAAEQRAAEQRAAEQRAAATTAAAAPTASDLRALSTPAPRYPPEALRANQSGEVQVEFTVGTDGSVTAARVVRANPPRVFDREAVNAVRRWRFQPVASPVTTRRTIGFNPGG
ncbi:MAG: energy transducer TonB [Pseudomonas sp.]|nr:energy transducer TonB [Pseudomonas sp.]